jgi:hypothetical protein
LSKIVPPETAKKAAKKLAIVKVNGGKNVVLPDTQGAHGVSRLKIKVNIPAPKNVNTLMKKIVFRAERKATIDEAITPLKIYSN